jgi:hypothetical protein
MDLYYRLRQHFSTTALILSIAALVLALAGGALAANSSGGGKATASAGKRGKPGPRGPKGETGAPGAPGTNGTNGKDGAPGAKGENGTAGASGKSVKLINQAPTNCAEGGYTYEVEGSGVKNEVCNGEEGAPGNTGNTGPPGAPGAAGSPWVVGQAPAGAVLKGTWAIHTTAGAAEERIPIPVSFGVPASVAEGVDLIAQGATSDPLEPVEVECPGSFGSPAPAINKPPTGPTSPKKGVLCLYMSQTDAQANLNEWEFFGDFFGEGSAGLGSGGGVIVAPRAHAAGAITAYGTWAVIAE